MVDDADLDVQRCDLLLELLDAVLDLAEWTGVSHLHALLLELVLQLLNAVLHVHDLAVEFGHAVVVVLLHLREFVEPDHVFLVLLCGFVEVHVDAALARLDAVAGAREFGGEPLERVLDVGHDAADVAAQLLHLGDLVAPVLQVLLGLHLQRGRHALQLEFPLVRVDL